MLLPNWLWIIIIVGAFAFCMINMEFARSKFVLSTTHSAVSVNGLPRILDGMKFVLISDLHNMSFGNKNAELARKVRRERPDYILFAGNMGNAKAADIDAFYDFLDSVGRDIPVVMVPGKEDLRLGNGTLHKNFVKSVSEAGGVILNNSRAEINVDGEKIYIYGYCPGLKADPNKPVKDWKYQKVRSNDVFEALGECPRDATVILLTSFPKAFEAYSRWGASLVFAGGTHGGYYRIPVIDRLIRNNRISYSYGEYRMARCKMFITRGLSSPSRTRFNNPPEISVISITRPNSPLLKTMPVNTDNAYDVFMYWARSESRAIRDLLNERTDALRDWWDALTHKEQSVYARKGRENKEKTVYMSPQERARENARRAMKGSGPIRRVSRVKSRSEYISELQAEMGNADAVHSYDKFKTAEEIEKIKVFGDIKI